MSKREKEMEIVEKLARIEELVKGNKDLVENMAATALKPLETKVDNISNNITKVVYALIGIIAATVGVQFTPHSPIDWFLGADQGFRFVATLTIIFTAMMVWQAHRRKTFTLHNPKWLVVGLIFWAIASLIGIFVVVFPPDVEPFLLFLLLLPIRVIYILALGWYSWHVSDKVK